MSRTRLVMASVALAVMVIGSNWSLTPALQAASGAHVDISTPVTPPRKMIHSVAPVYPPGAVSLGIEADIDLMLTVNAAGEVISTENVLSHPMIRPDDQNAGERAEFVADNPWAFNAAAAAAARQWKFERGKTQWKSVFAFRFRLTSDANQTRNVSRPSIGSLAPSNISGSARPGEVVSTPPSSPVRVGGDVKAPHKIVDVQPLYPENARAAQAKGVVLLDVTIAADGSVANTQVLRSIPLLDQAAIDAVTQWKFKPTLFHGAPVAVQMLIYINFVPPNE